MSLPLILIHDHLPVRVLQLHRPSVRNALSTPLFAALNEALEDAEKDPAVRALVLTGDEKAFAAGADIAEMAEYCFPQTYQDDIITRSWERLRSFRKPVIAAVAGYALGGGCELALMCDFIIAGENAVFGQPEIKLGIMPGAGGTQRLTRLIGRAKTMDLCLTGRLMDVQEAERSGLVSRIVPTEKLLSEAIEAAKTISKYPSPAVKMIKESILYGEDSFLGQGLQFERRFFQSLFGTEDQTEGMKAFLEKRPPHFKDI